MRFGRYPFPLSSWAMAAVVQKVLTDAENVVSDNPTFCEDKLKAYIKVIPNHLADRYMEVIIVLLREFKKENLFHKIVHPGCTRIEIMPPSTTYLCVKSLRCQRQPLESNPGEIVAFRNPWVLPSHQDDVSVEVTTVTYIANFASEMVFMKNLTIIKIPFVCTAELLEAISINCPALVELDISDCKFQSGEIRCLIRCRFLHIIRFAVFSTELEYKGIDNDEDVAELIKELTNLRSLPDYNLYCVIKYLNVLDSTYEKYAMELACIEGDGDFQKLCLLFPNLKEIKGTTNLTEADVLALKNLVHLQTISLGYMSAHRLMYLVKGIEHRLKALTLKDIHGDINKLFSFTSFKKLERFYFESCYGNNLDFRLVNKFAPNLKELYLECCTVKQIQKGMYKNNSEAFPYLLKLGIYGNLTVEQIQYLLGSSSELSSFEIHNTRYPRSQMFNPPPEVINDHFLINVLSEKKNLKNIHITSRALTLDSIHYIVDNFPKLDCLYLTSDRVLLGEYQLNHDIMMSRKGRNLIHKLIHRFPLMTTITLRDSLLLGISAESVEEEPCFVDKWTRRERRKKSDCAKTR